MTPNPDANPPESKSNREPKTTPPARSTLHDEIVTLRLVLKTATRHGWLSHFPIYPRHTAHAREDRAPPVVQSC